MMPLEKFLLFFAKDSSMHDLHCFSVFIAFALMTKPDNAAVTHSLGYINL